MKRVVEAQIKELAALKAEKKQLDADIKTLQAVILASMDEKSVTILDGERTIRATSVQGTKSIWDESALRSALGQSGWLKVSTRVLDKRKLEARIEAGDIKPEIVAECVTIEDTEKYLKITS